MQLDKSVADRIDGIFERAAMDGRRALFEHEVYGILELIGLRVPRFAFIEDEKRVDAGLLAPLGDNVIVKIVSSGIAHKSKLGGVRKVKADDPLFVRFVLHAMREEVLSHFPEGSKPPINGYLIAEFIPFTLALGNEILIGVKEDASFGPVLTLSKGGDDAEFFSRYYDPANLVLAPLDRGEAEAITQGLKIRHRYEEAGHPDYCALMAEAIEAISRLAFQYSFMAKRRPKFYLTAMDVNPFVFAENGRFVAVDGFAEFATEEEHGLHPLRPDPSGLKSFFEPEGIAVAGVSSDPAKYSMARIIVELLAEMGRTDVYCVNPKGGTARIAGREYVLYGGLAALPVRCTLIVYAAPAGRLMDFLETVPDRSSVILISGMPMDVRFEDFSAAVMRHRARGIRMVGPNCMGAFFAPDSKRKGVDTLFIGEDRLKLGYTARSNCALFTQSGGMAITSVERVQNAPIFKSIVSFGNKVDVNVPDLIRYFERDSSIEVIAIYLEGLGPGEGREFYELAKSSRKPIVVYKAGRTEEGAKAAASHTAAMSGSYDLFQAACDQAGAVLIEELPDFYNAMKAFSMLSRKIPTGNRVAGVVNAGLDATMGADLLGYLKQAAFAASTSDRLRRINTHGLANVGSSFLDVTPMSDDAMFCEFLEAVLADPGVDCAFTAFVPHIENLKTTDERCRDPDSVATRIIALAERSAKPLVVSINAGNHYLGLVRYLEEGGVPVFSDIRSAVKALETFTRYHVSRREGAGR